MKIIVHMPKSEAKQHLVAFMSKAEAIRFALEYYKPAYAYLEDK